MHNKNLLLYVLDWGKNSSLDETNYNSFFQNKTNRIKTLKTKETVLRNPIKKNEINNITSSECFLRTKFKNIWTILVGM